MRAPTWSGPSLIIGLLLAGSCVGLPKLATAPLPTSFIPAVDAAAQEIAALRGLAATGDEDALADALDRAMAAIPAGEFIMGSDAGRADERPAHTVYLDAYELDRYDRRAALQPRQ